MPKQPVLKKPKRTKMVQVRITHPLHEHAVARANAAYEGCLSDYMRMLIERDRLDYGVMKTTAEVA